MPLILRLSNSYDILWGTIGDILINSTGLSKYARQEVKGDLLRTVVKKKAEQQSPCLAPVKLIIIQIWSALTIFNTKDQPITRSGMQWLGKNQDRNFQRKTEPDVVFVLYRVILVFGDRRTNWSWFTHIHRDLPRFDCNSQTGM